VRLVWRVVCACRVVCAMNVARKRVGGLGLLVCVVRRVLCVTSAVTGARSVCVRSGARGKHRAVPQCALEQCVECWHDKWCVWSALQVACTPRCW
jgi:hypothetical protein